ncbi:unnamed protein product [Urochloa decumbens]|uniref:Uncharacterized protein n=1 Tax=Urochloa decumbens TaxID=240449 RepID=A0ABC8XPQ1_9POAL
MAPRALQMLTCFNIAVHVPLPAEGEGSAKTKRRWSGEIKRKILSSTRRERIAAVKEDEEPCDGNVLGKQRAPPERKVAEQQATTVVLRPALKPDIRSGPHDVATAAARIRERKGLRVRFDLPAEETIVAAPLEPPPRFPTGVLGKPLESFACSGPEMTAAFLASVIAAGDAGSDTPIDRELVAVWTKRKEACSRRSSYLRDYCPFQREEEDDEETEESRETTTPLPAETDRAETAPPLVKTEVEFVKVIRSSYLLKDDFISRCAAEEEAAGGRRRRPSGAVQELKAS